ncbi:DUF3299 domain-containing protein [uncultured Arcticibacterium sp.]|uniref:DUF3299 domain-containing protein n=1 Tax=uncultured Arcticibacterium sp. TaxID=2173042 RepID=UPI0030F58A62
MTFKSLLLISTLFWGTAFTLDEPTVITWKTLTDVSFDKKWNQEEGMFILIPKFGTSVTPLKDKQVQITGYMIPIDIETNYYVLSANPYASCFFCGGAGPESVMSIKFKGPVKRFDTDDRVTLSGKLTLNRDNLEELNYILSEATLVEKK